MVNVGDFVRIQMGIVNLGETPNYLYGKVVELQSGDMFAKVELSEPYKGAKNTVVPRYMARRIPEDMYRIQTKNHVKSSDNIDCDHNWVYTGDSPIFGTKWYNCSICNMKKEDYDKERKL